MIRLALMFAGGLMLALGALWALQGLGIIAWPSGSVMLAQREWAQYGAITMVIGAVIVWIGRRAGPAKRR